MTRYLRTLAAAGVLLSVLLGDQAAFAEK